MLRLAFVGSRTLDAGAVVADVSRLAGTGQDSRRPGRQPHGGESEDRGRVFLAAEHTVVRTALRVVVAFEVGGRAAHLG